MMLGDVVVGWLLVDTWNLGVVIHDLCGDDAYLK